MKRLLVFFLIIINGFIYAQTYKVQEFKIKPKPTPTVVAHIADQFEGTMSMDTILAHHRIELKPNRGEIISFQTLIQERGKTSLYRCINANFAPRLVSILQNTQAKSVIFYKISALINGDTVRLNSIFLELGNKKSKKLEFPICVSTYGKSVDSNRIQLSNPNKLKSLRGYYNGEVLELKSFSMRYYIMGEETVQTIAGINDIERAINVVKRLKPGHSVVLSNMTYKRNGKLIRGSPLLLKIVS